MFDGRRLLVFSLLACGTTLGLAGTDLVLPALPTLPPVLGGDIALARWVIAAFIAGVAAGLVLFGAVARGLGRRTTLASALLFYALLSFACTRALTLYPLILMRFFQGVFASAAAVIVTTMAGTIDQFITMQIVGVTCFIVAANLSGGLTRRFGPETIITVGTVLACGCALAILGYALAGGHQASALPWLFAPLNFALGLRGPPGFFRAVMAGKGDDERASSLTLLAIMTVASGGTGLLAPFLHVGLIALGLAAALAQALAVACLLLLPRQEPV